MDWDNTICFFIGLAKSKGKITHYFFLEGLKVLLFAKHLENFKKENYISD